MSSLSPGRARLARLALYAVAFVAIRAVLWRDFPLILTGDSWDFLGATSRIADRLDFSDSGVGLRDCRTPGYPVFQAILSPITGLRSSRIILAQSALGLVAAALGCCVGMAARSPRAAEALAVFLGLNPVYLLHEHCLMSEGLSLALLLAMTAVALARIGDRAAGPWGGAALGALSAMNALTRVNALPFCVILSAGAILSRPGSAGRKGMARAASAWVLAFLVVAGPWIERNHRLYGKVSLNLFQYRALLIYKAMHQRLDPKQPQLRRTLDALSWGNVDYNGLWKLKAEYGTVGSEEVAARLLKEQWRAHPGRQARDVLDSLRGFAGLHGPAEDDRTPVRYWFRALAGDVAAVDRLHDGSASQAVTLGLHYERACGDSSELRGWRWCGLAYLEAFRPLLVLAFLGSLGSWRLARVGERTRRDYAIRWLSAAYFSMVGFHALTLTDSDRFSSLYDWAAVLVILLVVAGRPRPARSGPVADDGRVALAEDDRCHQHARHSPHPSHRLDSILRWLLRRLTTKLSGPGHGSISIESTGSAARGRGPLQRQVRRRSRRIRHGSKVLESAGRPPPSLRGAR